MENMQEWEELHQALNEDVSQKPWSQIIDETWMKGW